MAGLIVALLVVCAGWVSAQEGDTPPAGLMSKLADTDFKTRQASQEALAEWGRNNLDAGISVFYGTYREAEDPEVRARSRVLLRELVIFKQSGEGKGYLGIRMQAEELMLEGGRVRSVVRVTDVMEGTPAQKAGLRAEDLIVGIDDLEVRREASLETFGEYVQSRKPRTDVTLHVLRNGKPTDVAVNLMRRPADLEDRAFLWGGESYVPPAQAEVEEQEFREWLRQKRDQEKQSE